MKMVNSIFISRPPGTVWAFLENPANMLLWNPNVKRVSPSSFSERPRLGYRYAITYQMHERARPQEFLAEFVHFEPFSRLVIRYTEDLSPHHRIIEEAYEISERNGGSFLTQSIHIENSGINIFLRILIWIVQRWGEPTGRPHLETLREIIERETEKDRGR
jgi:uncharacterized protein YndB with AHSA1/START domain